MTVIQRRQDIAIIGGGPAGLVAASVAGQLGLRVTLVEKSAQLGGDCLHTGCVPSKTLLHLAQTVQVTRQGVHDGLLSGMPEVDFGVAIDRVRAVIGQIQQHDDPERFRGYGCDVRFGAAHFTGPGEITVEDDIIRARRFLIATGSTPAIPPIAGLAEAGYDTNETIFTRRELPRRLAVLGAGPVGVELAQAFARLGARVTLVEQARQILPMSEPDVAAVLQNVLEREGIEVHTAAAVQSVRRDGDSRQLQLADGTTVECERILVATGRRPALLELGLDAAGVVFDKHGNTRQCAAAHLATPHLRSGRRLWTLSIHPHGRVPGRHRTGEHGIQVPEKGGLPGGAARGLHRSRGGHGRPGPCGGG